MEIITNRPGFDRQVGRLYRGQGSDVLLHGYRPDAPWTIIKSDDKKRARLNCMRHFLSALNYDDKDYDTVGEPDPFIVTSSDHAVANSEHILGTSLHPQQRRSKKKS